MRVIAAVFLLLAAAAASSASADDRVERALRLEAAGEADAALALWEELGAEGDRHAMVGAGLIYQQGLGRPIDYDKALDWYLKSMDGDALNNMGVMFRDGTGVPRNGKIAYLMFLTVHMTGMGSEATIMRANRNLRASIAALPREEIDEALCYTVDHFIAYIESRGALTGVPEDLQASPERKRIRELGWWREGELAPYDCPAGT